MLRILALLALTCVLLCPAAHANDSFKEGFVTRLAAPNDFDVNGVHVLLGPKTHFTVKSWQGTTSTQRIITTKQTTIPALYLGEQIEVSGDDRSNSTEIRAKHILVLAAQVNRVSGVGMIDLVPATSDSFEGKLFRADGYLMLIPAATAVTFTSPLKSLDDLHTNQWVRYHGTQRPDGVVVLEKAEISPNTINHREDNLRAKSDYDPAAIDKGDAQSGLGKAFLGKDPKRLAAWHDAAMQARVERIGNSLIPAFQKELPEDDPTRIDFRFQVVDEPKHGDSWPLASGIILVPYQLVDRLPSDSQLAAVLADSIAEVLEKQDLRVMPAKHKLLAADVAGAAAGAFIPGAGLVSGFTYPMSLSLEARALQQSGRVARCLLHDAGYDITQAPMAWWTLAGKKGDPLPRETPDRSLPLYQALGSIWQPKSLVWQLGLDKPIRS